MPAGVGSPEDNIIYDVENGFGHPECGVSDEPDVNSMVTTACPTNDGATASCVMPN